MHFALIGGPPATRRMALATVTVAVLAGCAAGAVPSASVEPTPAERPPVPGGWRAVTSDEGDIRLVVPPGASVLFTAGGILLQAPRLAPNTADDSRELFEIWVSGPDALVDQPRAGQSTVQWLAQSGWMPAEDDPALGPVTERETLLPAGPALEVRASTHPGTPEEGRAVIYAIATDRGLAILRFVGTPAVLEERAIHIELISRLAEFGGLAEAS
jgi:hypothetical protein